MRIYDPHAHCTVVLTACECLEGAPALVRSPSTGEWFVHDLWTNTSGLLEDAPEELRMRVRAHQDEAEASVVECLELGAVDVPELTLESLVANYADVCEGVEDQNALKAVFVIGASGSGKSGIAREMFAGLDLKFIDQDRHLERLYREQGLPVDDVGDHVPGGYQMFKQAQGLARIEREAYAQQRLGLVIDATGWDYRRVAGPVHRLRGMGYDTHLVAVYTSLATAHQRNQDRGVRGERMVPDSVVNRTWAGVYRTFPRYVKLFGKKSVTILDNDLDLSPEEWRMQVGPRLRTSALKLLRRPLKNKAGRKWLVAQRAAKKRRRTESVRVVLPVLSEAFGDSGAVNRVV